MWFLQNLIHELSHGLYIWVIYRWKFKIHPFPSKQLGEFTWSYISYMPKNKSKKIYVNGWASISIFPKIVNIILFSISGISLIFISKKIYIFILIFMFFNFIDFSSGLLHIFHKKNDSDIWDFICYSKIPLRKIKILSLVWIIFMSILHVPYFYIILKGII
jgi:hypothetical protein